MADETLPIGTDPAQGAVQSALRLAAPRVRTVDDHMFRPFGNGASASFRLQLFTAEGQRPVAVASQTMHEGMSLTNAAESYAAAVWERHCPGEELPPVWVQRHLHDREGGTKDRFELVTFGEAEPYRLRSPKWRAISPEQLAELVGGPVAEDRGAGYVPREPLPEPEPQFEVMAVWRLSRPEPFRAPKCMPAGTRWWRRWLRQAVPSHRVRDCCWYHRGDWHAVNRMALAFLAEGVEAGVAVEDMARFADERSAAAGADKWQRQALDSLFSLAVAITPSEGGGFVNGQHRAQAMLDAGVRRTVVVRDVWPEGA
ncbi:hypothetical protein ACFWA9_29130 [Kitasatospora sp. NPDC059973]|uniref:hypothetical protein n=1 Tax=Kitasatospora sp. NPDC059973 TaxID=3347020 RepID=UPI0036CA627B